MPICARFVDGRGGWNGWEDELAGLEVVSVGKEQDCDRKAVVCLPELLNSCWLCYCFFGMLQLVGTRTATGSRSEPKSRPSDTVNSSWGQMHCSAREPCSESTNHNFAWITGDFVESRVPWSFVSKYTASALSDHVISILLPSSVITLTPYIANNANKVRTQLRLDHRITGGDFVGRSRDW